MLELIFPLHSAHTEWTTAECAHQQICSSPDEQQISLLVCSNPELVSSLLLQAAVSCNASGGRVVYITTKPWQQLPKLVHGMSKPDPVHMQRVQMLYLNAVDQLISYCADIHQPHQVLPDIILVHGLDVYASHSAAHDSRQHSMARLCALLCDTASFIACKRAGSFCRIIASLSDVDNAYAAVYSRFIKDVWNVRNISCPGDEGDDTEKYEVVRSSGSMMSSSSVAVEFVITAESLCLLRVLQHDSTQVSTTI